MSARQDPTRRDDVLFMLLHGGAASGSIARHVVDLAISEALEPQAAEVARLQAERHSTNEALSDAAEQLRVQRDRIAELEAAAAMARRLHTKFPDSEHCQHDGERWPCPTVTHLQRPGCMDEQRHLMDDLDHVFEALALPHPTDAGSTL